ncbi:hypothetical protein BBG47_06300 [Paenibacillus sp. KS1]|uniref:acyl-CoA thioesterase/bile acid-CoA:amino acid N-acyltransferase family protein n=1 Tax=Paenibacillus sp. KS1 TaxID=1849249 RepID=UPI00080666DA|nr:acyl-CoA thioesterase/bile acid-CoA:amino acid N-acyltransferase family protein [Paenibacillus sp. KS1]OBY80471.1 hypothetical protein BBG47_06300 [Paenibacillus sp. KS1]
MLKPTIEMVRATELADEPIAIRVNGLQAGSRYKVAAAMPDDMERKWLSEAVFTADIHGAIDTSKQAPESGTYQGVDAGGVLWSMQLQMDTGELSYDNPNSIPYFMKMNISPQTITISLYDDSHLLDQTTFTTKYVSDQVQVEEINEGFVGKYFFPGQCSNLPAVIVVGGSGGGFFWSEQVAALLAARGIAAVAVAYFDFYGHYGLSRELTNIPLETFAECIRWLQARKEIDENRIGAAGISKGGELVLLLGATFPEELKAVVAFAPSLYVLQGIRIGSSEKSSSWSYQGKPLDFLPYPDDYETAMNFDKSKLRDIHNRAFENTEAKQKSQIPVERMKCHLLLISGDKDELGTTSEMSAEAMQILQRESYPYETFHLRYPNGGHSFHIPNLPPVSLSPQVELRDVAHAERDAWTKMMEFWQQYL